MSKERHDIVDPKPDAAVLVRVCFEKHLLKDTLQNVRVSNIALAINHQAQRSLESGQKQQQRAKGYRAFFFSQHQRHPAVRQLIMSQNPQECTSPLKVIFGDVAFVIFVIKGKGEQLRGVLPTKVSRTTR
jgi:hypothetical protein